MSDFVAIGVLARTFPPELVDEVIAECGRGEQRRRLLPARTVVYLVLALCLFPHWSYEEVARLLRDSSNLAGADSRTGPIPTTAAISRARAKLGPEPLKSLFIEATQRRPGPRRGPDERRRTVALDFSVLKMPGSPENHERYGRRPGPQHSRSFPQVRLVGVTECQTHTIVRAAIGTSPGAPFTLAGKLLETLVAGDLLLVSGDLASLTLLPSIRASGADLLWQIDPPALPVLAGLPDGSYLSVISTGNGPVEIRVLEPAVEPFDIQTVRSSGQLVTTMLNPEAVPRRELIASWEQRWTIRNALEELRLERDGGAHVLRSHWPGGVEQELWGLLLVQHAVRSFLH